MNVVYVWIRFELFAQESSEMFLRIYMEEGENEKRWEIACFLRRSSVHISADNGRANSRGGEVMAMK